MDRRTLLTTALFAFGVGRLPVPAFVQTALAQDQAAAKTWRHGLSLFGDLKYPPNFPHFDYVDPRPETIAARDRILSLGREYAVDIRAAALQFCAAHPVVCAVIPGAKSPDKVAQNAAFMCQKIPAAFWTALKTERLIPQHAPTPDPTTVQSKT